MKKLLLIVLPFCLLVFTSSVNAQVDSLGIAIPIETSDEVISGDIICTEEGGLVRCSEGYQPSIYGVVTANPPLALESPDTPDSPLAVTTGDASVRVSAVNGSIAVGDLVTSSENPGVGQKATLNGFALGVAMESFESDNPNEIGEVLVSINIHPISSFAGSRTNLVSNIRQALSAPVVAPLDSFRYLLAFIIALISFALGFLYFGRVVRSGVEAIGRNPLASRTIQVTIVINIVITVVIVLTGLAIALLVLVI
jgi:F0F1-type ATP synthase membrane subunit c/vacuolar-type H+-ATPase subunit K